MLRKCILSILVIFSCITYALADPPIKIVDGNFTKYDNVTYIGYTGGSITIAWDGVDDPDVTGYELRAYVVEKDWYTPAIRVDKTITSYTYTTNMSGHYVFQVRSVDEAGHHSIWVESTNATYATVDGVHRSWWVYSFTAPPSNIGFE